MIPLLAIAPAEFQTAALAWGAVASTLIVALLGALIKIVPMVIELRSQLRDAHDRLDRHRTEISTLQTNAVPPAMLPALLAPPAAPAAAEVTDALAANTAATEENTAAQQAGT